MVFSLWNHSRIGVYVTEALTKMSALGSLYSPRGWLLSLILGCWRPLSPSSVLGDCSPEPAEKTTATKQTEVFFRVSRKERWLQSNTTQYFFRSPMAKALVCTSRLVLLASLKNAVPNLKTKIGICSLHIWRWNFYPSTSGLRGMYRSARASVQSRLLKWRTKGFERDLLSAPVFAYSTPSLAVCWLCLLGL